MSVFQDVVKDLQGMYPDLTLDDSGKTARKFITTSVDLVLYDDRKPVEWETVDKKTNDVQRVADVKGAPRLIILEFVNVFNGFLAEAEKNTIVVGTDGAGAVGVESDTNLGDAEQETLSEAEKLAMLDEIMDGKVEPVKATHHAKNDKPISKYPAVIPTNVRSKQIAELTNSDIIDYLCPKATEKEAMIFLKVCQAKGINPFLKEAYLVKYKQEDPASIVVAKDYFARKAEEHPMYDGEESGVILMAKDGALERRAGAFMLPDENLVGGWCKVYRKDRARPVLTEVAFHEYVQKTRDGTPNKFWNKMSATMIQKVAFSQCHRKAFPGEFSGLYDSSEIEGCMEGLEDSVIEASYEEVRA